MNNMYKIENDYKLKIFCRIVLCRLWSFAMDISLVFLHWRFCSEVCFEILVIGAFASGFILRRGHTKEPIVVQNLEHVLVRFAHDSLAPTSVSTCRRNSWHRQWTLAASTATSGVVMSDVVVRPGSLPSPAAGEVVCRLTGDPGCDDPKEFCLFSVAVAGAEGELSLLEGAKDDARVHRLVA